MSKLSMLIAGGIGYVLGARAGRERYDQIAGTVTKVKNDPRVQEKAQQVADVAREQAPVVKDKVASAATSAASTASGAASAAASKVGRSGPDDELLEQLHPDSTARHGNPGPQGDLP
jgi:cysteine synthase